MANTTGVGTLARLWRFPVKSMKGELLDVTEVTARGVVGDRGYALLDVGTGKVASAKSVRRFPRLFACSAAYLSAPRPGDDLPPVRITLPDGRSTTSEARDADKVLTDFFGRDVQLIRQAPEEFAIDMYYPDVPGADPAGYADEVVDQKVGASYWKQAGLDSPVPPGSFLDLFPSSVLTTSTVNHLNVLQPSSNFDERRFRMNFVVETPQTGFVENEWIGKDLSIGEQVKLHVACGDPRCVMTTLAIDDLPQDTDILRVLVKHNRIDFGEGGMLPCAGVYATVGGTGVVRVGDRVAVG